MANYYDEITRFDYYIGEVVKKLKEKGAYENTVIVIMADNGRPFPHSKTRVNHQGVKTPFIVHYPKAIATRNTVNESLVSAVDIAPTLIDLAGIDPIDRFQGVSFKKLLLGATDRFRNYVLQSTIGMIMKLMNEWLVTRITCTLKTKDHNLLSGVH